MYRLVPLLVEFFDDTFPGFKEQKDFIIRVIEQEELSFLRTLEGGIKRFESLKISKNEISGKDAFEMYDTYGFPVDLTRLMASERGWSLDESGFNNALQEQKKRSRSDAAKTTGDWIEINSSKDVPVFAGYDADVIQDARLIRYRQIEDRDGVQYQLVLDKTSFYPEGGGQVGDSGQLVFGEEKIEVADMIKDNDLPIHITRRLPANKAVTVTTNIDAGRRRLIENNHSATHLLHAALREVLGDHVQQKGSLVNEEYLRFDFSHFAKVSTDELARIESLVNQKIRANIQKQEDRNVPIAAAEKAGARMLFGEKYGDKVRMITFDPSFSIELCGGCHVSQTGTIGYFKISGETAVAAGVRRIEALTAQAAENYINDQLVQLSSIRQELKNAVDPLKAIRELQVEIKDLRSQIERVEIGKLAGVKESLMKKVETTNGIKFLSSEVNITDQKLMKSLIYQIGEELGEGSFLLLGSRDDQKASLMLFISEDLVTSKKLHAGNMIKELARAVNGGGGGQPFFASAGGTEPTGLNTALEKAREMISN